MGMAAKRHVVSRAGRYRKWVRYLPSGYKRGAAPTRRCPVCAGVGLAGSHVVYAVGGTIRSLDGAFNLPLLSDGVEFWHFFGAPSSTH
jgi:hypothetical protein